MTRSSWRVLNNLTYDMKTSGKMKTQSKNSFLPLLFWIIHKNKLIYSKISKIIWNLGVKKSAVEIDVGFVRFLNSTIVEREIKQVYTGCPTRIVHENSRFNYEDVGLLIFLQWHKLPFFEWKAKFNLHIRSLRFRIYTFWVNILIENSYIIFQRRFNFDYYEIIGFPSVKFKPSRFRDCELPEKCLDHLSYDF